MQKIFVGAGALDGPFASTLYMFIRGVEGAAPYMIWIELSPQLYDNLFNKSFPLRNLGKNDIIILLSYSNRKEMGR